MVPYRIGDEVCIISFDELKSDPDAIEHGFDHGLSEDDDTFYGIADYIIDNWSTISSSGGIYIRERGHNVSGEYDYRLETLEGEPLPYYWLHCMLRPADECGSEEMVNPGSLEDLFDFLQD